MAAEQKLKSEQKDKQAQLDATAKEKFQALNVMRGDRKGVVSSHRISSESKGPNEASGEGARCSEGQG